MTPNLRSQSPTSVTAFYPEMIFRRFVTFNHGRGPVAYDLFETLNRIQWLMDQGRIDLDYGERIKNKIMVIRYDDNVDLTTMGIYDPSTTGSVWNNLMIGAESWFQLHGVRVAMENYDQERVDDRYFANAMVALAETLDETQPTEAETDDEVEIEMVIDMVTGNITHYATNDTPEHAAQA